MAAVPGTENIVEFSVNANPNTAGTIFDPNQSQDGDVVYISSIDNLTWKWNGTTYVTYTPPTTSWALGGNTLTSQKVIGTKSNHNLPFVTNNVTRMTIT